MTMNVHFLYELFQLIAVSALVVGCAIYCLLSLAPNSLKQSLRKALSHLPMPAAFAIKPAQPGTAGGCASNCGACSAKADTTRTVQWHPRKL